MECLVYEYAIKKSYYYKMLEEETPMYAINIY